LNNYYNKEKYLPFIKKLEDGDWFYQDGRIWRRKKRYNAYKVVGLENPEIASYAAPNGYRRVSDRGVAAYEHVVVYIWFNGIDSLDSFQCIDHKNFDKTDNRIENLEGVTIRENSMRAERANRVSRTYGKINGMCRIGDEDIKKIFSLRDTGLSQKKIGDIVGVNQSHVCNILNGKSRKFG
jgi:hypothetical protein